MNPWLITLAQATTQPTQPPMSGGEVFLRQFMPILLIIGVFWWWLWRSRKKEKDRFEQMLSSLKRNDRIQTIGGIIGTVVEAREDEVVVKVDESNNVKMRFNRGAIKEVIRDSSSETP